MSQSKLEFGDQRAIARAMGLPEVTVQKVLRGERGKRGTALQKNIIKAAQYREKQHQQLEEYCRQLQCEEVVPA